MKDDYRKSFNHRPQYFKSGYPIAIPKSLCLKNDERALALRFVINRPLFGECYRRLLPEYFYSMPHDSGVLIRSCATTQRLFPEVTFPGDIDLLVIPYEADELILSKTLAIELKIVRAKFSKQSRSPNEYGFSQAQALLKCGFPYVAVAHLIVSDESPFSSWQTTYLTKIIDNEGRCEEPWLGTLDLMPSDLLNRSYGRLLANSPVEKIGLIAAYIADKEDSFWFPRGKPAIFNEKTTFQRMDAIGNYYAINYRSFIDTKRY